MSAPADLRAELENAIHLPYGLARSAAIEAVVERADAVGDDPLARDARQVLVSSYAQGGEPLKRFLPFSWLVQRYEAEPDFFDARATDELLWSFKGVTVDAVNHPGISLAQIENGLADMERHYRAAGQELAPFFGCRYAIEAHIHGEAAAEESYLAWTRAPRTYLSDCEGCEPTDRVIHLVRTERFADAAREALLMLDREFGARAAGA
jgi:hypothetical protein